MMQLRAVLPNVFQKQRDFQQLGAFHQRFPRGQADFQKTRPISVMPRVIAGVTDHLYRAKHRYQIEQLLQPGARHLTDEGILATGTEIPERAMQRDADVLPPQLLRHAPGFGA
jgi:hypothetical protein